MNPFQDPVLVNPEINEEIKQIIQNQLKETGKIMFFDSVQMIEKAIADKDIPRAKILAFYITKSLLKSQMPERDRNFIILGFKEEIEKLENFIA